MSDWKDCIVILIDLIGVKDLAREGDSQASSLMRRFHEMVHQEMQTGLSSLNHAYVWNDATLLLAYVDGDSRTFEKIIADTSRLKQKVDTIKPYYAIAVKGQAFPTDYDPDTYENDNLRVTVLRTSSYAMANCFQIEAAAKKQGLNMAWYVDERIADKLAGPKHASITVELLPDGDDRKIYMYPVDLFAMG
jgi:hypothetical protein